MNAKHLLAMLTLATAVGCNSIQRSSFDSFDEYLYMKVNGKK